MAEAPDDPHDPRTWIAFAESCVELARAGYGRAGVRFEDLCFHTQQAVEKALKALMIARAIEVPRTHAIGLLLDRLSENGVGIPEAVNSAVDLTVYAVRTRYPGGPPVNEADFVQALQIAVAVLQWVKNTLGST